MMQKLKESESNLKSQIADLSITLMNSHPKLKALRSQLGGIQVQMRQETARILSSIETEAKVAKLRDSFTEKADQIRALQGKGYAPLMRFGQYTVDVVRLDEDGKPAKDDDGGPKRGKRERE